MLEESLEEKKNRKERREELESVSLPTDIYINTSLYRHSCIQSDEFAVLIRCAASCQQ